MLKETRGARDRPFDPAAPPMTTARFTETVTGACEESFTSEKTSAAVVNGFIISGSPPLNAGEKRWQIRSITTDLYEY